MKRMTSDIVIGKGQLEDIVLDYCFQTGLVSGNRNSIFGRWPQPSGLDALNWISPAKEQRKEDLYQKDRKWYEYYTVGIMEGEDIARMIFLGLDKICEAIQFILKIPAVTRVIEVDKRGVLTVKPIRKPKHRFVQTEIVG